MQKNYKNNKVVITTVPFVDENTPLAAPAVLKAALQENGIQCIGLDLNIDIYNKLKHHPDKNLFINFFYKQIIDEKIVDDLIKMLRFFVDEIMYHKPTIVGLSLFSSGSQVFAMWLCAMLKQQVPDVKIVIGGPGLETLENSLFKFPDRLKRLGLIDDYITGDAERSMVEYVNGNTNYPGINSWSWLPNENFKTNPPPDYSDYTLLRYEYPLLPIIDSRGCVQDCEFCDVIAFWKKFQYLTADAIFERMQLYIGKYHTRRFQFGSSICNGNLREFKKLIKLIAEYNDAVSVDEQIHWIGSFIIRPKSQHPESMWYDIKKSNGFLLTGVESVIEKVRINLGKNFTNQDLEHHLIMGQKYQVPMNLLMIAAYPTETASDHENVKKWFIDHKNFANNTVQQVQLTLLGILPGTVLESKLNPDTFKSDETNRKKKGIELLKVIKECGFNARPLF